MRDKTAISCAVILQLLPDKRPGIDWALKAWWRNPRLDGGMRLTEEGHKVMHSLGVEAWRYDVDPKHLTPRMLVLLDQRLQDPYFLKPDRQKPWISFYGSKEALLLNLYGDLSKFLENYSG